jgi:hypothetical protein
MSTQPAVTPTAIAPETVATLDGQAVHEAREPIMPPERSASEAAREPIRAPEPSTQSATAVTQPGEQPHAVASIPAPVSNVLMPDEYSKAESNLAAFIATKLDPKLAGDKYPLMLTLSNILSDSPEGKTGGTDLQLCFKGEMIEANFAEMQREIIKALQVHPVLSQILKEHPSLQMEQVTNEEQGQMMHLHLPNLTPEQYANVIRALAKDAHLTVAPLKPHAEEVLSAPVQAPVVAPVVKEEAVPAEVPTAIAPATPTETVPAPVVPAVPPVITPQPKPLAESVPLAASKPAAIIGVPAEQQQTVVQPTGPVVAK